MPLVTMTPIPLIFPASPPTFYRAPEFTEDGTDAIVWGPFRFVSGGVTALYLLVLYNAGASSTPKIALIKSVNKGITWNIVGNATAPADFISTPLANACAFYPSSENGIISICFETLDQANTAVVDFNCATDSYGAVSALATPDPWKFSRGLSLFKQPNGDYWIVYAIVGGVMGLPSGLYYLKLSGGVWSAETLFSPIIGNNTSLQLNNGVLDTATGDMHFTYSYYAGGGLIGLTTQWIKLSTAAAVAGPSALPQAFINTGTSTIWQNNKLVMGSFDFTDFKVRALVGTPLNAPVWTVTILDGPYSQMPDEIDGSYLEALLDKDGNVRIAWCVENIPQGSSAPPNQILMSENSGSGWDVTPTLIWDEATDDQAIPGYTSVFGPHTLGAIELADGTWIFATALDISGPVGSPCAGFVLVSSPPVPTLNLDMHTSTSPPISPVVNPTVCVNQT